MLEADRVDQLCSLLAISRGEASRLLLAASHNVERAVALHFDTPAHSRERPQAKSADSNAINHENRLPFSQVQSSSTQSSTIGETIRAFPDTPREHASPDACTHAAVPALTATATTSAAGHARAPGVQRTNSADASSSVAQRNEKNSCSTDQVHTSENSRVRFAEVASVLRSVEKERSRLRIRSLLAALFADVLLRDGPEDLARCALLATGRIAPCFQRMELGIGGTTVAQCVVEAAGSTRDALRGAYRQSGDLGDAAELVFRRGAMRQQTLAKPRPLLIADVFGALRSIADTQGAGARGRTRGRILGLLRKCTEPDELRFLVRILIRDLRIGASRKTVVSALASALTHVGRMASSSLPPNASPPAPSMTLLTAFEEGFARLPDLGALVVRCAAAALAAVRQIASGAQHVAAEQAALDAARAVNISPGVPPLPMLAQATTTIQDTWEFLRRRKHICEFKYDGERAQIHRLPDGTVRVFSRKGEDATARHADAANAAARACRDPHLPFIIDAEIVAIKRPTQDERRENASAPQILSFQELSTRARPSIVAQKDSKRRRAAVSLDQFWKPPPAEPAATAPITSNAVGNRIMCDTSFVGSSPEGAARVPSRTPESPCAHESTGVPTEAHLSNDNWRRTHHAQPSGKQSGDGVCAMDAGTPTVNSYDGEHSSLLSQFMYEAEAHISTGDSANKPDGAQVDVCVFAFDILYGPGGDATALPLSARRKLMCDTFEKLEGIFDFANGREVVSEEDLRALVTEAVQGRCEGIVAKVLDAPYEPDKRSQAWRKLKRDYCEELQDTLDLVPIGAWHGTGRKSQWLSPILLACFDRDTDSFQSVCRCMSGFSDTAYRDITERLQRRPTRHPSVITGECPPIWLEPSEVWEICGADLTLSPVHTAALGKCISGIERGVALRFPRFRRMRIDKHPEDATSASEIARLYLAQTRRIRGANEENGEQCDAEEATERASPHSGSSLEEPSGDPFPEAE